MLLRTKFNGEYLEVSNDTIANHELNKFETILFRDGLPIAAEIRKKGEKSRESILFLGSKSFVQLVDKDFFTGLDINRDRLRENKPLIYRHLYECIVEEELRS